MTGQAPFTLRGRNPDVLSCIANLSNDEVFTPPEFANQMLVEGLKEQMPDLQARVDHILTKQVFGIGITRLTAMMARRSVYCSKHARGPHSICKKFPTDDGNIWFERVEHSWEGTKCRYCGAPKSVLDRGEDRENYAYPFIHTDDIKTRIKEIFGGDMQFDVIIGNPPYQMDNGDSSDIPIYQHFVRQAKALEPRYLVMVIPSRRMAGGKWLEYYLTRFFRFLVSLRKITQHAGRMTYSWVPMQTWDRQWTDAELYAKYKLTPEEIAYIEFVIRPMEANGEGNT